MYQIRMGGHDMDLENGVDTYVEESIDKGSTGEDIELVKEEEGSKFNRLEMDFGLDEGEVEEETNTIDLSSLHFSDDTLTNIQPSIDRFVELGLTSDQIVAVLEESTEKDETEQEKIAYLKATLTKDEKRNYTKLNTFVDEMLTGTELSGEDIDELMLDPSAVKILNIIYGKVHGKTQRTKTRATKSPTKDNTKEIEKGILDVYRKANLPKEEKYSRMLKLFNQSTNKEWAKKEFKEYLK